MLLKKEIDETNKQEILYYGTNEDNITSIVRNPILTKEEQEIVEKTMKENIEISNEELQAQIILNQTEIIAKQNEQDEVLAEILLQQIGGM